MPGQESIPEAPQLSRRSFIKGLAAVSAGIAIGSTLDSEPTYAVSTTDEDFADRQAREAMGGYEIESHQNTDTTPQTPLETVDVPDKTTDEQVTSGTVNNEPKEDDSYRDTTEKSLAYSLPTSVLLRVASRFGLNLGNAAATNPNTHKGRLVQRNFNDLTRGEMIVGSFDMIVTTPAAEEALFRLAPSKILNAFGAEGNQWPAGLLLSARFAALHSTNPETGERSLPIAQFGLGALAWWLQRNRGFTHAVTSHVITNAVAMTPSIAKYEANRVAENINDRRHKTKKPATAAIKSLADIERELVKEDHGGSVASHVSSGTKREYPPRPSTSRKRNKKPRSF